MPNSYKSGDLRFLPPARWTTEGGGGRNPASSINKTAPDMRERSVTWTALGSLVPVNYGRCPVVGLLGPWGKIGSDLVVSYIWGIGPIDAIESIYLNDTLAPSGVQIRNYLGDPNQGVDSWLAAAVAGFNDRMRIPSQGGFRGVAYTVLRIPTSAGIEGFPRARAMGRWLNNIYDPRTDTVGWSDNSALCLGNWLMDKDFGLGGEFVDDLSLGAEWCDTLLGGVLPRCRIGISIQQGRPSREYAVKLAEHAECFFVDEGEGFRLIPDAPVVLGQTPIIDGSKFVKGSLRVSSSPETDTPTEVTVQYMAPGEDPEKPWALEQTEPASLTGVVEGEVSRIPSSVTLDGVTRYAEAYNKAYARLVRLQNRVEVSWSSFDVGVLYQPGDVVRINRTERGVGMMPVRITQVRVTEPGRHSFTATRYDPSHYPDDIVMPEGEGILPTGAIVIHTGGEIPPGFELFAEANGRILKGAGGSSLPGDVGGVQALGPLSGSVGSGGSHASDSTGGSIGASEPWFQSTAYRAFGLFHGAHGHSFSVGTFSPNLLRRNTVLLKMVGAPLVDVPPSIGVWGADNLTSNRLQKNISFEGRFVAPSNVSGNAGTSSMTITVGTSVESDVHSHATTEFNRRNPPPTSFPAPPGTITSSGGSSHSHSLSLSFTCSVSSIEVCLYTSGSSFPVSPGTIIGWSGDLNSLPEDWVLCDGTKNTPDMRDRYVKYAGERGKSTNGSNTFRLSGGTNSVSHSHPTVSVSETTPGSIVTGHTSAVAHSHSASITGTYEPAYYALAFLMYVPGE